jgi:uncharacterized protein
VRFLGKQPDLEGFRALTGNLKLTLLALAWILAAFGEEMVYRGCLMNRVADLLNRTPRAWIVSLVIVHVGFGLAHAHQGPTGVIDEGLMGLLLGLISLRTGRNLSVPIVAPIRAHAERRGQRLQLWSGQPLIIPWSFPNTRERCEYPAPRS